MCILGNSNLGAGTLIFKMETKEQFEQEFEKMKQELKFKATLEELDEVFFLKDFMMKEGFVSEKLSRAVCGRIADGFGGWGGYLHGLLLPNPSSIVNSTESQLFSDEEKQSITSVMNKTLEMTSRNSLIGLTKDKAEEAKFIDDSLDVWNNTLKPKLTEVMEKVNKHWENPNKQL